MKEIQHCWQNSFVIMTCCLTEHKPYFSKQNQNMYSVNVTGNSISLVEFGVCMCNDNNNSDMSYIVIIYVVYSYSPTTLIVYKQTSSVIHSCCNKPHVVYTQAGRALADGGGDESGTDHTRTFHPVPGEDLG